MLKIGQRVIFVDAPIGMTRHPHVVYPELHEIVTIGHMFIDPLGRLCIVPKEYPKPIFGEVNGILSICFRPIDETFAEDVLKKIEEEIKQEGLVLLN